MTANDHDRAAADRCPLCHLPRHAHARIVVGRSEVRYICGQNTTGVGGPAFTTTGDWGVPP